MYSTRTLSDCISEFKDGSDWHQLLTHTRTLSLSISEIENGLD